MTLKNSGKPRVRASEQTPLFEKTTTAPVGTSNSPEISPTLDELTAEAIRSGFNAELIGKQLLAFSEMPDGIEKALAYSAILVKARRARLLSSHSERTGIKNPSTAGQGAKGGDPPR